MSKIKNSTDKKNNLLEDISDLDYPKDYPKNNLQKDEKKKGFKLNIDFNLTERQKQFSAILLAATLALIISFGVAYFTNPTFKESIFPETKVADTTISGGQLDANLEILGQSLSKLNVDDILYDVINLEDVPVYPIAWVEKFFSLSERQNSLISGPSGDPDNDGLSNKQEFFFGSNPRNRDSLCLGKLSGPQCNGKSDGENVTNNISPLTGGIIASTRSFKVNKQNAKLLDTLQSSFENSSREGVDFPTLFQLSKEINLDEYFNSFKVVGVENNRESFSKYLQARTDIIQGFVDDSELNSLTEIYGTNDINQLKVVKDLYQSRLDTLKTAPVPNRYVETHKAYLVIFSKIVQLVEYRSEGIRNDNLEDAAYKEGSKKLAVETVWGYRKLSEEVAKFNVT